MTRPRRPPGLHVLRARGGELERDFAFGGDPPAVRGALRAAPTPSAPRCWPARPRPPRGPWPPARPGCAARRPGAGFAALHGIYWLATHSRWRRSCSRSTTCTGSRGRRCGPSGTSRAARRSPDRARGGAPPWRAGRTGGAARRPARRARGARCRLRPAPRPRWPPSSARRSGRRRRALRRLRGATAGNPFYLGELLGTLAVDGHDADPVTVARRRDPILADRVGRRIARAPRPGRRRDGPRDGGARRRRPAGRRRGRREARRGAALRQPRRACAAWSSSRARTRLRSRTRSCAARSTTRCRSPSATRPTPAAARLAARDRPGASPEAVAAHRAAVRPTGSPAAVVALRDAPAHGAAWPAPHHRRRSAGWRGLWTRVHRTRRGRSS